MNHLAKTRARMSCNEYVADYLDRKDIQGFPTNATVLKAREEWQELQNELLQEESEEAYGDYLARQRGEF